MTNLYDITIAPGNHHYCFAKNSDEALMMIANQLPNVDVSNLIAKDITQEKISEDGVQYLRESNFVGTPNKKYFMLHGSEQAKSSHYTKKGRSGVLWYNQSDPLSDLWTR